MWYALLGYDIKATPSSYTMFGHERVLPPALVDIEIACAFPAI
jgi:hypothetical protein